MIDAAADGDCRQREAFAKCYGFVIRAYLKARWKSLQLYQEVDDAAQDVFAECFRDDGPLDKVERERAGGFRPFLYGVVRNIARRIEQKHVSEKHGRVSGVELDAYPADTPELSKSFEQAWAQAMMRQAADLQKLRAQQQGGESLQRVELLRLRFQHGLPIREIAVKWGVDPAQLHREYAKARNEFREALTEVVALNLPNAQEAVETECRSLLAALG